MPISFLLAGAGAISLGAALGDQGLTADPATGRGGWRFSNQPRAPFPVNPGLAIRAGLHAPIVGHKGLPARAGHDPVFRHLLGVPGPAPGIDRGLWLVQPAAVADDQSVSLVFDAATDQYRHGVVLWEVVRLMDP